MDSIGSRTIVVGIDGTANSAASLEWAVAEASARGLRLHLYAAGVWQGSGDELVVDEGSVDAAVAREALEAANLHLAVAAGIVTDSVPGLVVTVESGLDRAADRLVALSSRARSIVLGRSGHGRVAGVVLGSVAAKVVTHAQCPVVVVHAVGQATAGGSGVAVGVDGSAISQIALAQAFEQASLRGVGLHVIHAWWTRASAGQTPCTRADQLAQQQLMLAGAIAGWSERYPDVEVRTSMPVGPTVLAITEAAADAELLVVGSRGHGGLRGLLIGSVSRGVLQHARCPVVVVHERDRDPDRSGTFGADVRSGIAGA